MRKTWPGDPRNENDFVVVLDGKTDLARIRLETFAHQNVIWSWSVYGFAIGQDNSMRGNEETFDKAKAKTKAVIERLIAAETKLMPPANEWRPGRPYVA